MGSRQQSHRWPARLQEAGQASQGENGPMPGHAQMLFVMDKARKPIALQVMKWEKRRRSVGQLELEAGEQTTTP